MLQFIGNSLTNSIPEHLTDTQLPNIFEAKMQESVIQLVRTCSIRTACTGLGDKCVFYHLSL
jgi:hypothetical protein